MTNLEEDEVRLNYTIFCIGSRQIAYIFIIHVQYSSGPYTSVLLRITQVAKVVKIHSEVILLIFILHTSV